METQRYTINLGPQHPSTHGVLRIVLELDGEICMGSETVIGYLHRGMEKLAEERTYSQFIPYTDRLDYLAGLTNEMGYVQAIEKLMDIEVPERAEYIRVIIAELMRVASHLIGIGVFVMDIGAMTALFYPMIEREKILDLFSMICGARLTFNYMRVGGVAQDLPEEFFPALEKFMDEFPKALQEYEDLINDNEIFRYRTINVGSISAEEAKSYGLTGPNLRASGVEYDLRKMDPYSVYDRFDFDIPIGKNGDCYDRYIVRIEEMKESMKIIKQAVEQMPEGPIKAKVPKMLKPPVGDVYHQMENARGVFGTYLVSDGTVNPYRTHFRRPSFNNLSIFDKLFIGHKIADVIAIIASFDFDLGEVDA